MRVKKILSYVKLKVKEYPKIDYIIEGWELSKETQSNRDINSFISYTSLLILFMI